jgi:hypothetical protein
MKDQGILGLLYNGDDLFSHIHHRPQEAGN